MDRVQSLDPEIDIDLNVGSSKSHVLTTGGYQGLQRPGALKHNWGGLYLFPPSLNHSQQLGEQKDGRELL